MNKRIFRKVRVIGEIIMVADIACHTYRLIKNEICPWICDKIHKNKNAGVAEEYGAPSTNSKVNELQ